MKPRKRKLPNPAAEDLTARNVQTIAELEKATTGPAAFSDRLADRITTFCGTMSFLWLHVAWFAVWIGGNLSFGGKALDPYPFNFLTLMVSLEAIFLSTFILISEIRQSRMSERRSHSICRSIFWRSKRTRKCSRCSKPSL